MDHSLSQPLPNPNITIYNAFRNLKESFDAEPIHPEYRIWSGRFNNFMDAIRNYQQRITQRNICAVLSSCNGYGTWVASNVILRYYENASVDSWIDDVKGRLRRAQQQRIASPRHADAARVARAARGRARVQGVIRRGVGGVMAVQRARRGRGRGRGSGRAIAPRQGTKIFL